MDPTNALNARASQAFGADAYPPAEPVPSLPPATAATHSLVAASGEQCPSCGTQVAPDQRYCLTCGARCGEPRLPIMDAVTFMDAMKQPRDASAPPPQRPQRRVSSNTALFATIGVLLLAMGVGVLIGRSGNHSVASAPQSAPIVIHGGGEEAEVASNKGTSSAGAIGGSSKEQKPKALKKAAETQEGAESVLKPANGVKLPPAKVEVGGKCEKGTAGCKGGEFTGNYFE